MTAGPCTICGLPYCLQPEIHRTSLRPTTKEPTMKTFTVRRYDPTNIITETIKANFFVIESGAVEFTRLNSPAQQGGEPVDVAVLAFPIAYLVDIREVE